MTIWSTAGPPSPAPEWGPGLGVLILSSLPVSETFDLEVVVSPTLGLRGKFRLLSAPFLQFFSTFPVYGHPVGQSAAG